MNITTGVIQSAQKVLIYGVEGIGKSTLAAEFPEPLFIDTEGSTKHMDVRRLDAPQSWTMLLEEVRYVVVNPSSCRTLVIDTADEAEALAIAHVCAVHQWDGIEQKDYGKGYVYLAEEFGKLLNLLTECVDRGVNVVVTAHSQVKQFKAPDESTPYDRWELRLQKKTAPMVRAWADMVVFANYKTFAVIDSKTKKVTGSGGKRTLFTTHKPAWDAKNRHGLPDEMPFEDSKGKPIMPKELLAAVPAIALPSIADAIAEEFAEEGGAKEAPPIITSDELIAEQVALGNVTVVDRAGSTPVAEPTLPTTEIPPHLKSLYQLMVAENVVEAEVRGAVAGKGYFPEVTPIEKYPTDFVEGVLIAAWPQVLELIKAGRTAA